MRAMRIEGANKALYNKIAKMVERDGAKAVVPTDKIIMRTDKDVYTYLGTNHDSLRAALAYALGADKIRHWYVVEKEGDKPIMLRAIQDEILTYKGSIKESKEESSRNKEVNPKKEYIKKITG